ncbi:MAG: MutH/Sau3AI family endonuclease [Myxococcota bacterium]
MLPTTPPHAEEVLLARAQRIAGRSVRWLRDACQGSDGQLRTRHKGMVGQLVEAWTCASGQGHGVPDFPALGIELKTLPVNPNGRPRESTWVTAAPTGAEVPATWEASPVCRKLTRVLWVPVRVEPGAAAGERVFGMPFLWSPDAAQEATLREDWDELGELLRLGSDEVFDARRGKALQLRPKARDSRVSRWRLDERGDWVLSNPRGFYLRASFTRAILQAKFAMP